MTAATKTEVRGPNFGAYVLFSEPVQFHPQEIRDALIEDYPSLDLQFDAQQDATIDDILPGMLDTAGFITHPLILSAKGADKAITSLIRMPGYGTWDPAGVRPVQRLYCPDIAERLGRNASYLCISVGAEDDSMLSAFRAARLMSCIAAVFAKLPVTLGAYMEPSDQFLDPDSIIDMADKACSDDWPITKWMGIELNPDPVQGTFEGYTKGLAAFTGYELRYAPAPVGPEETARWLIATATMAVEMGNDFQDGNTISVEGSDELRLRIRDYSEAEGEQRFKVIFHPDSPIDHEEMCGPCDVLPPPPGVDNKIQPNVGFFKRLIRGQRAQ